ncbi:uncharacterized protein METZ01_LOCUS152617 [marine metagenome]|uniref:Uncharacterized protein n=1 Tax=marine metagenome TaxID=408172 RepID=A0A382AFJ3_9ZZZZ
MSPSSIFYSADGTGSDELFSIDTDLSPYYYGTNIISMPNLC